ncbi:unnamed protein product [Candidula unifasciata]|uniref:UBA domain-containing protein n=1 Tax=Candidula unifasciata TaxID=100452 RepID=A0A8S3YGB4_9EUPU|nr:unnamed protein product [Candidula unifasciata]
MQQQVMKRNMSSEFGWGSGADGGLGQQSSTSGSGAWTSTPNLENTSSPSTSWQVMGKSDSASDAGDDASSVKSGSTITNVTNNTPQSQDSTNTSNTGALQTSSSPWSTSNSTLPSMDSSPWGNSSSSAVSSIGSVGWASNPPGLSLAGNNTGHNQQPGSNIIGSNSAFNSSSNSTSSSLWPSNLSGSTSNQPPNMGGSLSAQWPSSSMLGNIGDLSKGSDSAWNHPASSVIDNKDLSGASSDPRMWGMSSDKASEGQWDTSKSQWGNNALAASADHSSSGTELSFAQATLKGLKIPPTPTTPQSLVSSRQEDILRAIESHEGWGSRPVRQDTSWDVDNSPKSQRKFSTDGNAAASNVWNNSNGTAIWEALRGNHSNNWSGAASSGGNSWNVDKDQTSWGGPPKPAQDPNTWNMGANADPKTFATWGATGGAGDASNKMWGQKTEVGSWGEGGVQRPPGVSSWGDDGDGGGWEDQHRMAAGVGGMQMMVPPSPALGGPAGMPAIVPQGIPGMNTAVVNSEPGAWNDGQKPGWNSASSAAVSRSNLDEPWNKPPPTRTGWGDPAQDGADIDNGTGIWVAATPKQLPPQAKVASWGEASQQGQWNAAVGAKAKAPGGWDEASWAIAQRAKQLPSQQVPQKYMSSGSHPPTQMRAKLLQQLMDLGYRKEEAQNALITNNLNLEMAINDLKSGNVNMARKDLDMDVFQTNISQSRMPYISKGGLGSEELSDMRPDQVPTYNNLQNTPFPNAQIPNQPFMASNASLPASGLNASNSSINSSLQQKLMQKMQQQQAPPSFGQRGAPVPPVGTATNNPLPPQQQQQIRSQLRQAVSSGLISQQLLNYQLPHNILVLLQQLLQLQTALQNVVGKQQQLMQQARSTGSRSNPQLEQMPGIISSINQQIISVQKQLQQAQSTFFSSQKPPSLSQTSGTITPQSNQQPGVAMMDTLDALSTDLANVALQSQSRLTTQWKPSMDASAAATADTTTTNSAVTAANKVDDGGDSKAPGAKGLLQSSSSPNLSLIPGGLGMTGDKTWSSNMSSTTSSNWPMSSSQNIASNSQTDVKVCNSSSTSTSLLSGLHSGLSDVIPEFVPGKPWQGLAKNVEDDPHVTPGSIQYQRSLSVNRVHDDSLHNLDGHKLPNSSWGANLKSDNSLGLSQLGTRPPPSMSSTMTKGVGQHWQPAAANFNRHTCWPHSANSAFTKVTGSGWNENTGAISSWLLLKNLTVDPNTVRALCAQHGTLLSFYTVAQGQLALVQYNSREIAFGAQQHLNNFQMGTSIITAEFIAETDAQRFTAQIPPPQPTAFPPMNTSPWSQAPPATPFQNAGMRGGDPWSSNSMLSQPSSKFASAGENLWGLWDRSDHNFNPLSNILGGESM